MKTHPFNTGEPLAYFLTWTTYGAWLPGDERGWQRRNEIEIQPPDKLFKEMAVADMVESPFLASKTDRDNIRQTVERHCQIRQWDLHKLNVRSNHIHVVVTAPDYEPNTVRDQLKAWCTRNLKKLHPGRKRFWTEGASCRWINHEDDLESAILYISDEVQDEKRKTKPR